MQSVGEQLGIGNLENFRPHAALISADAVGVELELEGFTSSATNTAQQHLHPLWSTTADGSLRNGGVELITNGGLGGEQLYAAFERVASLLERINYDASWRCSTHMHINMRDFTVQQVARFMMVYAACEPVLFAHCGKFRYSSNFCVPVADSIPFHKKLISRFHDNVIATRAAAQLTVKYTAMNFQPLFGDGRGRPALGTVEFRGGRPMTTVAEFVLQTNLLLSIKQFVRDHSDEKMGDMLTRLNEGVLNTVYANGCAAELEVRQDLLDEGILHAWMLLKAYQKGMKTPAPSARPRGFSSSAAVEALESLARRQGGEQVARRLTREQIEAAGFFNPGDFLGPDHAVGNPQRELSPTNYPAAGRAANDVWNSPAHTPRQHMVALAQCLRADLRMSEDVACGIAARWFMNYRDTELMGAVPTRAGVCFAHTVVSVVDRGNAVWSYRNRPWNNQPRFTWGDARFDWMVSLSDMAKRDVVRHAGTRARNIEVWDWLLNTQVKLKRVTELRDRLHERGFTSAEFPAGPNGTVMVQAAFLMYLLRVADLPSINHVHANHVGLYDRVAAVVELLLTANQSVPFFKHYAHAGHGLIRCEHTLDAPMGHNVSREHFRNLTAQRQPRNSQTTGRVVN